MSLIKCPECGREISYYAEICPGCGKALKSLTKYSNYEQYVLDKRNTINKKRIMGIAVIIVTIVIAVLIFTRLNPRDDGLFENHAWGTSYSDLANDLEKNNGKTPSGDGSSNLYETIENYYGMDGIEAGVVYQFGRTGLSSVKVFLTFRSTQYTADDVLEMMKEKFNKMYGDGRALQSGMFILEYQTDWVTENSIISLVNYSDDMVVIDYNPN